MSKAIEEKLSYFFFDKRHLTRALCTPAYVQEHQTGEDQQVYAVLGENVLQTVLTDLLIRSGCQTAAEIADRKQPLLAPTKLAEISEAVNVGFLIKFSSEEKQQRVYDQPEVLATGLMAVIGAVYYDGGYTATREMIRRLYPTEFDPNLV